jgi:hypothetical protein
MRATNRYDLMHRTVRTLWTCAAAAPTEGGLLFFVEKNNKSRKPGLVLVFMALSLHDEIELALRCGAHRRIPVTQASNIIQSALGTDRVSTDRLTHNYAKVRGSDFLTATDVWSVSTQAKSLATAAAIPPLLYGVPGVVHLLSFLILMVLFFLAVSNSNPQLNVQNHFLARR